jgi:hypothetical protein
MLGGMATQRSTAGGPVGLTDGVGGVTLITVPVEKAVLFTICQSSEPRNALRRAHVGVSNELYREETLDRRQRSQDQRQP